MRLSELISDGNPAREVNIVGLSADSREVKPGYLFAALPGTCLEGRRYIADAIRHGAVAILASPEESVKDDRVSLVTDQNPRRRFTQLVARFFGAQPAHIIAVTGTNGKSSVVSFTRQIWLKLGCPAASIGTLGLVSGTQTLETGLTTPDPVTLHRQLKDLKAAGIEYVALEASSHGLSQYRLDGVSLRAAAFTGLTRDHLVYHASEEDYLYAKLRLFGDILPPGGMAVLNRTNPHFSEAEALCWARGHRILTLGDDQSDLVCESRPDAAHGYQLDIRFQGEAYRVAFPLIGSFQIENALTAAALVLACGGKPAEVFAALSHLSLVPGRLQLAGRHSSGASIYVDYAHTPDALRQLLQAVRPHAQSRLLLVFGCGGDRDPGKRQVMGEVADTGADVIFVTDDNPRHEQSARIRAQILEGCPRAREIGERAQAISVAISELAAGDILVIAGKGHEQGQIVGDITLPFDDVQEVAKVLGIGGSLT